MSCFLSAITYTCNLLAKCSLTNQSPISLTVFYFFVFPGLNLPTVLGKHGVYCVISHLAVPAGTKNRCSFIHNCFQKDQIETKKLNCIYKGGQNQDNGYLKTSTEYMMAMNTRLSLFFYTISKIHILIFTPTLPTGIF